MTNTKKPHPGFTHEHGCTSTVDSKQAAALAPLPDVDLLPQSMRDAKRWLLWKSIPSGDGKKPRKVPYYANGLQRSGVLDTAEDMARFVAIQAALNALATGDYAGLGFALGPDGTGNCWQGIDLDGVAGNAALQILAEELPGFTETSPSGNGVHAIGYGKSFTALGSNATGIEAYSSGRFFTVTADAAGQHEPCCLADFVEKQLSPLHRRSSVPDSNVDSVACNGYLADDQPDPQQITELRSALYFMRSDDRTIWERMGHALRTAGETGRGLWLEWSAMSAKFDPADAARVWSSFRPIHTHWKAVLSEAQGQGWINPRSNAAQLAPVAHTSGEAALFAPVSVGDVLVNPEPPHQFVWGQYIPCDALTLLSAHGGAGKSGFGLQLAAHVAMGRDFLGFSVLQRNALFFSGEDSAGVVRRRLAAICRNHDFEPAELACHLHVLDATRCAELWGAGAAAGSKRIGSPTASYQALRAYALKHSIGFAVVDNASDTFGGDRFDKSDVSRFVRALQTMFGGEADTQGGAVMLLSHVNRGTAARQSAESENYSDSVAWHNAARSRLFMSVAKDSTTRTLAHEKSNYGAKGPELALDALPECGLALTSGNSLQPLGGDLARALIEPKAMQALLVLVNEYYGRGEYITPSHNSPNANAWAMLKDDPGFPSVAVRDKKTLISLMREMERKGYLAKELYAKPNRHEGERWIVTATGLGFAQIDSAPSASSAPTPIDFEHDALDAS